MSSNDDFRFLFEDYTEATADSNSVHNDEDVGVDAGSSVGVAVHDSNQAAVQPPCGYSTSNGNGAMSLDPMHPFNYEGMHGLINAPHHGHRDAASTLSLNSASMLSTNYSSSVATGPPTTTPWAAGLSPSMIQTFHPHASSGTMSSGTIPTVPHEHFGFPPQVGSPFSMAPPAPTWNPSPSSKRRAVSDISTVKKRRPRVTEEATKLIEERTARLNEILQDVGFVNKYGSEMGFKADLQGQPDESSLRPVDYPCAFFKHIDAVMGASGSPETYPVVTASSIILVNGDDNAAQYVALSQEQYEVIIELFKKILPGVRTILLTRSASQEDERDQLWPTLHEMISLNGRFVCPRCPAGCASIFTWEALVSAKGFLFKKSISDSIGLGNLGETLYVLHGGERALFFSPRKIRKSIHCFNQ